MKREHFIALCLLIVAVFLAVRVGKSASREVSTEGGSDQQVRNVPKADRSESGEGELKQLRTKRVHRETKQKIVTESGLVYQIHEEGEGDHPGPNSEVKVHYVGMFENGTVFDSSRDRGMPVVIPLNHVIKGWSEGVQLMKPGARYRFEIPPDLGYGDMPNPQIPAGSTLVFEIELISIESP